MWIYCVRKILKENHVEYSVGKGMAEWQKNMLKQRKG
jgi:hypothetical protein